MKYIFLAVFAFCMSYSFAQTGNSVTVFKDPRIDVLLKKQAEVNNASTRNSTKRRTARGYRLLVLSTSDRTEAMGARTKILTYFPDLKAYMSHQSPFYKIKAGNFTSRSDAADYQKRLTGFFPNGVFIVNDIVEVKPEQGDDE